MNPELEQLKQRIDELERQMREHQHEGVVGREVSINNLVDMVEVVSVAPSGQKKRFSEQFKIYVNGATLRLYWYDQKANVWHYVTATA